MPNWRTGRTERCRSGSAAVPTSRERGLATSSLETKSAASEEMEQQLMGHAKFISRMER